MGLKFLFPSCGFSLAPDPPARNVEPPHVHLGVIAPFETCLPGSRLCFAPLSEKSAVQPEPLDQEAWCREVLSESNPSFGTDSCLKRFWKLQTKACSWGVGGRAPFTAPRFPVCTISAEGASSAFPIVFIYTECQILSPNPFPNSVPAGKLGAAYEVHVTWA